MANVSFNGVNGKRIHFNDSPLDTDASLLADISPQVRATVLRNLRAQNIPQEKWKKVLHTGPEVVPPAFALRDSREAAAMFVDAMTALAPDNKMAIWGDYDVDGNTSSTVLGSLARQIRPEAQENVIQHIPHRRMGYGLNIKELGELADKGVKNLFVVDIGTVAHKEIEYARSRGMKVVVIDHHQPRRDQPLPEGALIINPHRLDETKPELKNLSAAGLSWLFAKDVEETLRERGNATPINHGLITAAAALGTISDVVSVEDPLNRYIISQGLAEMETGRYPGIEALKGLFGIKKIRDSDVAFAIGPSINAAGRMNDPTVGMRMLLAATPEEAEKLAKELTAYNDERKQFSNNIILSHALEKAEEFIKNQPDAPVVMIEDEHWSSGVVGIIASRIKDRYGLPTLLGTRSKRPDGNDQISYSARSIADVHLLNALTDAAATLQQGDVIKLGGHGMAAGLTIKADAKDRMVEALSQAIKAPVQASRANDSVEIAAEMRPEELTVETVGAFFKYGAHGAKMNAPRILIKDVQVKQVRPMGEKGEHLSVSLGANGSTAPYESLRYGTAFRALDTELGKLLQDGNRHNQQFDVVVEPYLFEKMNGETAVGYHLIDASPARVVGHDPDPRQVLQAHKERLEEFRARQQQERQRILSLPLKLEELVEGKTPHAQEVLKYLHDANISLLDTETTGLNAGDPDLKKTDGITQISVSRAVKKEPKGNGEVKYELVEKVYAIKPVTPAFFEYEHAKKAADKNKTPAPEYNRARFEYEISPTALDVTGTEFVRSSDKGPIKDMLVGGHKVKDAKPFYSIASDIASFIGDSTPYIYNADFDTRVMKKHFDDVMAARDDSEKLLEERLHHMRELLTATLETSKSKTEKERSERGLALIEKVQTALDHGTIPNQVVQSAVQVLTEAGDDINDKLKALKAGIETHYLNERMTGRMPKLRIYDDAAREAYRKETSGLAKFMATDAGVELMKKLSDPLKYSCVMHASLLHKGEGPRSNLDSVAPLYDQNFLRAPDAHDAREDTRPLAEMAMQQAKAFAKEDASRIVNPRGLVLFPDFIEKAEEIIGRNGFNRQSTWETLIGRSDPDASATVVTGASTRKSDSTGNAEALQALKLTFPSADRHQGQLPGIGLYLSSLLPAQLRNSRIPMLVLDTDKNSVTINAAAKESGNIPISTTFKKSLCVDELYRSGLVSKIKAFDSTSLLDITLATPDGKDPVTIEDVPIAGLRKSVKFLLSPEARPHAKEYLELMRWFNELPQAGLTTFDETGITVRGLQRNFGETRMLLPPGKKLIDCIPDIKSRARDLLSLSSLPGTRNTEFNVEEDDLDSEDKKSKTQSLLFSTAYRLDKPGSMVMDISIPLLKLVAQEKGLRIDGDHINWPGGIVGQRMEGDHFLLNGSLETFSEVGSDIRNAAWLLHRFNQLPGVRAPKTRLTEDGKLTLTSSETIPVETLWILHRAHVPFKASRNSIEITMPDLMHDAYHWYWEIRKEHDFVKNEMEKKNPENPDFFLKALVDKLHDGSIHDVEVDRIGKVYARVGNYPLVPVKTGIKEEQYHVDSENPLGSPLFEPPKHGGIKHAGLAVRLSQLHGVQKQYSTLSRAQDGQCELATPHLRPLREKDIFVNEFREMSQRAQSAHINPLLDKLRTIVNSSDMRPDHNEPNSEESPVTMERLQNLRASIEAQVVPHFASIKRDVEGFAPPEPVKPKELKAKKGDDAQGEHSSETSQYEKDKKIHDTYVEHQKKFQEAIFRNVGELSLISKTLSDAHDKGRLAVPEEEYAAMQAALKEYYESLSMAEFKRYRLQKDGEDIDKAIRGLEKVLKNQQEPEGEKNKLAADLVYGPYMAHKELSNAIEKVWEAGKRYKRTLHFSEEIIACSANLRDWRKLAAVQKAAELTHGIQNHEVEHILGKIKAEGGIHGFTKDGDWGWKFDSDELEKKPNYWDARIAELQQGKEVIPQTPHMIIDTSSMLTLLLGTEAVPGDKQAGYLGLVQDLAKNAVVIPVITGAVLAEFLNSPVPLTPQDIFTMDANGKATSVKYTDENRRHLRFRQGSKSEVEYPKWHQRLEFLMDIYNNGHANFIQTPTELLYFEAIRSNADLQKSFEKIIKEYPAEQQAIHGKNHLKDLTNEELKAFLLTPHEARQQFMNQMRSAKIRKDIGEVSLADAIQSIHNRFGAQAPVFVLYEGNDVRGRLLMRKTRMVGKAVEADTYMAGNGKDAVITPELNPKHTRFNPDQSAALGNTNFLSTLGFLAGVMKTAKAHNVFIVSPDEHNHGIPADIDNPPPDSYPGKGKVIRNNAGKALNGYERAYSKFVDEPATELGQNPKHSKSFTEGTKGPWQRLMESQQPAAMREVLASHLMRERKFHEAKLGHHGDSSAKAARDIMVIDKHIRIIVDANGQPLSQPVAPQKLDTPEHDTASFIMTDLNGPDPRAVKFANAIVKEHNEVRGGSSKIGIRPRLPDSIRIEMLAVPAEFRASVIDDTSRILREKLGSSPENELYVSEYETMLRKLLLNTQRTAGRR